MKNKVILKKNFTEVTQYFTKIGTYSIRKWRVAFPN